MTNLEALRLPLKVLSKDEELKTIGYDFDVDEMERNFKKTAFNWLLRECPYI